MNCWGRSRLLAGALSLALVAPFPTSSRAENWVTYGQNEFAQWQVDTDSIQEIGKYRTFWDRDWATGSDHPDYAYERAVDCDSRLLGYGQIASNSPGEQYLTPLDQMDFTPPRTDAAARAEVQFVCSR